MRVILDTNVFVSGVFFGGFPARALGAWRDGHIQLVLSTEILEEYQRVGQTWGASIQESISNRSWPFSLSTRSS